MRQAIQLLNATKHSCLERDDVLENIVKFKLPPSIPLTPRWHHTQFKKLLVMVENFGMPHFFLTLTSNETSKFEMERN
jgi:hypothetical protein